LLFDQHRPDAVVAAVAGDFAAGQRRCGRSGQLLRVEGFDKNRLDAEALALPLNRVTPVRTALQIDEEKINAVHYFALSSTNRCKR